MELLCFHCGKKIEASGLGNFGRNETCPQCDSDVHVCLNCKHYDEHSYNDCREEQAERVLEKDRRNFCEYFSPRTARISAKSTDSENTRKKLDDLFK
ncbi:MAG: hypothetical protein GYA55_06855 [SAR324 cluster bacterium]|uniref:Uncharacterized protein n=1 Tax=SAR324 cluster bacterium TaxID=2024889 RepID=A0A7X9FS78_9DELT|nr:hypothetical protein [SAR324 cluster bacterium]